MFIETRYFDDGKAQARMVDQAPPANESSAYDRYVDEYDSVEEWLEELEIELDDIIPLVLNLSDGKWVDITAYV